VSIGVALWTMQSTAAAPRSYTALYRRIADEARLVEAHGFASMWFAEHRFWYDGWTPAPLVAAAAAAAVTTRLRIGTAMLLLPQADPLRVAEAAAVLDRLSGGRVDLGVGLGYRDEEYDGLGLARRHRGARMGEALDVVTAAWRHGRVSFAGRHLRYDDVAVAPPPCRPQGPPLWVGGMAPAALERGARRGLSFLLPPTLYVDEVAAAVQRVRDAAAAAAAAPGRIGIVKDAWIDRDAERARAFALPRLAAGYRDYGAWWTFKGGRYRGYERPDLVERQVQRALAAAIVGGPEEVAADVAALRDAGVDDVVLHLHRPTTRDAFADALGLLADAVLGAAA